MVFGSQIITVEYNNNNPFSVLRVSNEAAFEKVFKLYFKSLHAYAFTFTKEKATAEEIVQNVFFKIWEKNSHLQMDDSLKSYLYRAVHNESLNHIKHEKVKSSFQSGYSGYTEFTDADASEVIIAAELEDAIQKSIDQLPAQCRLIFQMSRFEQLKYQQIATQLNISIKTVENQMGKALKVLRQKLVEYLPFILFLFYLIQKS